MAALFGELGYKLSKFLNPVLALLTHILQALTEKQRNDDTWEKSSQEISGKEERNNNEVLAEDCAEGEGVKVSSLQRQCLRLITKLWVMLPDGGSHRLFLEKILAIVEPLMYELTNVNGSNKKWVAVIGL